MRIVESDAENPAPSDDSDGYQQRDIPMSVSHQRLGDVSYIQIAGTVEDGAAVRQQVVEVDAPVDLILDFDVEGRLLGIEIIGASDLLPRDLLAQFGVTGT
jgi:uncharacterized protein YuzE